ncbi:hypothetical protein OG410_41895 [Streptomyces sp. NBC_00659]|nr:hypothetical protein [Streptomyces sp. NBC_00659]
MTAVAIEITPRPAPVVADPDEVVLIGDVDMLTAGTTPGCNDDNPYQ